MTYRTKRCRGDAVQVKQSKRMTEAKKKTRKPGPLGRLRRQAEALLKKSPQAFSEASVEGMQNLVHELRVHQAELEMQNEELRRVQLDLENSRERFARLYDLAPVGYLTLDAEGVIREANLTAARLLGGDRQALLKTKLSRFVAAESQDDFYLHCQRVFTTPGQQACELQMHRPDGAAFSGRLETILETAGQGQPAQCLVALSDVTKRRQAETERARLAADMKARLAAIVESSDDAIISRNLDDTITTWNEGAERLFGYSAREIVGHSFTVLVAPDRRDEVRQIRQRIEQGERVAHYDTVRVAKDGRQIPVSSTSSPIKDASEKTVGISAILRDISRQKWAEGAIRQSEQALTDFFAEAPLGLLWVAPDGRILRVNQAQVAMLGRRGEELFGRQLVEFCADPEVVAGMLKRLARKEFLHDNLVRLLRKDRSLAHVLIDANGLWENGKLVHTRWFVRDVTRRLELEKEILTVSDRERQRIGQELHDDLCQQLTSVEFLTRALERRLQADSRAEAAQAKEIGQLTRRAITHTRELAHGMFPVELHAEGLAGGLRDLASRTKALFQIDCRFRCESSPHIHDQAAQIHLYRIAQEAVRNAVRHGKAGQIVIGLKSGENGIVLSVRDNGAGIPLNLRKGKGLGLRIMDHRASVLGGSVVVRKSHRGGTTVVCSIPAPPLKPPA
jgi:PAS domain S-box-containing protein